MVHEPPNIHMLVNRNKKILGEGLTSIKPGTYDHELASRAVAEIESRIGYPLSAEKVESMAEKVVNSRNYRIIKDHLVKKAGGEENLNRIIKTAPNNLDRFTGTSKNPKAENEIREHFEDLKKDVMSVEFTDGVIKNMVKGVILARGLTQPEANNHARKFNEETQEKLDEETREKYAAKTQEMLADEAAEEVMKRSADRASTIKQIVFAPSAEKTRKKLMSARVSAIERRKEALATRHIK